MNRQSYLLSQLPLAIAFGIGAIILLFVRPMWMLGPYTTETVFWQVIPIAAVLSACYPLARFYLRVLRLTVLNFGAVGVFVSGPLFLVLLFVRLMFAFWVWLHSPIIFIVGWIIERFIGKREIYYTPAGRDYESEMPSYEYFDSIDRERALRSEISRLEAEVRQEEAEERAARRAEKAQMRAARKEAKSSMNTRTAGGGFYDGTQDMLKR